MRSVVVSQSAGNPNRTFEADRWNVRLTDAGPLAGGLRPLVCPSGHDATVRRIRRIRAIPPHASACRSHASACRVYSDELAEHGLADLFLLLQMILLSGPHLHPRLARERGVLVATICAVLRVRLAPGVTRTALGLDVWLGDSRGGPHAGSDDGPVGTRHVGPRARGNGPCTAAATVRAPTANPVAAPLLHGTSIRPSRFALTSPLTHWPGSRQVCTADHRWSGIRLALIGPNFRQTGPS
ncbi:hypothetical protein C8K30_101474 [Promicromonospora sp. AC04]|nr:hypothetical protein C8K30_101474 [Promicromonospora sp. AC04]